MVSQIESFPATAAQLRTCTGTYRVLSSVARYTKGGWPRPVDTELQPYWRYRDEITMEVGCLFWGTRVVVPGNLRFKLLEELHCNHPGIARMKAVARSYMLWPAAICCIRNVSLDNELYQASRAKEALVATSQDPLLLL